MSYDKTELSEYKTQISTVVHLSSVDQNGGVN